MAYTPEPWRPCGWDIIGGDHSIVARVLPWDASGCRTEDHDNLRLIAAAPDLLAACKEMIQAMNDYECSVDDPPTPEHKEMMLRSMAAVEKASH